MCLIHRHRWDHEGTAVGPPPFAVSSELLMGSVRVGRWLLPHVCGALEETPVKNISFSLDKRRGEATGTFPDLSDKSSSSPGASEPSAQRPRCSHRRWKTLGCGGHGQRGLQRPWPPPGRICWPGFPDPWCSGWPQPWCAHPLTRVLLPLPSQPGDGPG